MKIGKLLISLGVCYLVAYAGSVLTISEITSWYAQLVKPFFSPPNYVFGPVWSILYTFMGISLYLIWVQGFQKKQVRQAMVVFLAQLFLNFCWSLVFFNLHLPLLAFFTIVALWIFIVLTIGSFYPLSKPAAYLLYPYLAWVSFASLLNLFIYLLN